MMCQAPTYPVPSTRAGRTGGRRSLAVGTPPRGWRRTKRLLECARECGLGVVTDKLGNLSEGRTGIAQLLSRDLHAPTGEIVHWRHADQADESVGQRRTRQADLAAKVI